jgi:hypothetical protein
MGEQNGADYPANDNAHWRRANWSFMNVSLGRSVCVIKLWVPCSAKSNIPIHILILKVWVSASMDQYHPIIKRVDFASMCGKNRCPREYTQRSN